MGAVASADKHKKIAGGKNPQDKGGTLQKEPGGGQKPRRRFLIKSAALAVGAAACFIGGSRIFSRKVAVAGGVGGGATAKTLSHHLPGGKFGNNYAPPLNKSFADLLKWRRESPSEESLRAEFIPADNDPAFLRANGGAEPTLTWIGHATFLLQIGGLNILTDPHFSQRASPVSFAGPRRMVAPGLAFADLPPIDAVLISHNHYDHLDRASVAKLAAQKKPPRFYVPLRLAQWVKARGAQDVRELDWWMEDSHRGVGVAAAPTQHWSGRGFADRNRSLWCGWMIQAASRRVFFCGDSGYSPDFQDIARRLGKPDLALLPIGAYAPRWFMRAAHMDPDEAVQTMKDLGAKRAAAMHWGTFVVTDEPATQPPQRLREALARAAVSPEHFTVMRHGETRRLNEWWDS
jgi:N-acyl-phosphatidylethanolamine-hydrolysing phospholipase D